MGMFTSTIFFIKVFLFVLSMLYVIKVIMGIVNVYVQKEGKVEFGKNGLLYLGMSLSYIITFIIC